MIADLSGRGNRPKGAVCGRCPWATGAAWNRTWRICNRHKTKFVVSLDDWCGDFNGESPTDLDDWISDLKFWQSTPCVES